MVGAIRKVRKNGYVEGSHNAPSSLQPPASSYTTLVYIDCWEFFRTYVNPSFKSSLRVFITSRATKNLSNVSKRIIFSHVSLKKKKKKKESPSL